MAKSLNKWIGIGNLTKDVELKFLSSGDASARVGMACNNSYKKKDGTQVDEVEYMNLSFYGKVAEIVEKYTHKGSKLYVEGRIKTDSWDKDGVTQYMTKVIVSDIMFLDPAPSSQAPQQAAAPATPAVNAQGEGYSDDIPF